MTVLASTAASYRPRYGVNVVPFTFGLALLAAIGRHGATAAAVEGARRSHLCGNRKRDEPSGERTA